MSSPDAPFPHEPVPHDPAGTEAQFEPAAVDPAGFDPAGFEDDAHYARARLGAADPARAPGGVGSSLEARRLLSSRLTHAATSPSERSGVRSGVTDLDLTARRRPARWLAVPIAAAIALVVGLVALQPFAEETPAGAAVVRAAASTTQAAGTARFSVSVEGLGQTVTADGVGDLADGDGRLTVHAPAPIGDVDVIHLGDDLYVSAPEVVGDVLGGARWVHVDRAALQSLAELAGQDGLGGLDLSVALDPVKAVEYVRSVSGEVVEVGPDNVGGDPVTHYSTHLDPSKLAEQLGGGADHDQLAQALATVGPVPLDLWIDGAGRLRRVTLHLDLGALPLPPLPDGGLQPDGTLTATFELSSFGVELDAVRPPADDVADVAPLLGLLRSAIGR